MRTAFLITLILVLSLSVGFSVFSLTNMYYMVSETQGPHEYNVEFDEEFQEKDLGVIVNVNLSFAKTWFIGEEKNVTLEVSAESISSLVQNFSWRIFWIELWTLRDEHLHVVGHGSLFLNDSEWNNFYLYKRLNVSVGTVNLNYLESVDNAWFGIEIMMDIFHNNTEYGFTFYTPRRQIGPVAILSPLYSPISLTFISFATTAISATLANQLLTKTTLTFKKRF